MALKAPCYWIDSTDGNSYLRWHFGTVGVAYADGNSLVQGWGVRHEYRAASHAQAKRFVEAWVYGRTGFPGMCRPKTFPTQHRGHFR